MIEAFAKSCNKSMEKKILLIEDDLDICEMVKSFLEHENFNVTTAHNGLEGLQIYFEGTYDLIILDIMMPKMDGIETLKSIREKSNIPIIIMSAKTEDLDKALGLGFGADDYISKPFSMIELLARIKANIRRATQYSSSEKDNEANVVQFDELIVDLDNYKVLKNEVEVKLTSTEFKILKLFVSHPSRVYTKAKIYNLIWEDSYHGDENIINVHISRLREKIEDNPSKPKFIKTLWGIGYKLGDFQ